MKDFWNKERPMTGMQRCDTNKVCCRYCIFAEKEHIGRGYCEQYSKDDRKPDDVYFNNAPCPKFKKGEDLLPYEIEI